MKLEILKDESSNIWGMVVYNIIIDSNNNNHVVLNGLWTNNFSQSRIMNEIARQRTKMEASDMLSGNYNSAFIEANRNEATNMEIVTVVADLQIILQSNGSYELIWRISNTDAFHGVGFQLNDLLVATYWEV